ncbi:MAG: CAP domain-containing protein [Candidatus Komeilibacteria bacterium]|nr:CAP domain-containing protein [Candidatus Komeilibacteria bacterium]
MLNNKKDRKIIDSDSDGLSDDEEKKYGTDPFNPDTDNDGMSDGEEVKIGRNPNGPGMLKDIFIPHKNNNYKPHALHPKRLAFHAISAITIKVIMVAFALSFPVQAWLSPDVLYQQAQKIIQLTNNIRAELGVAPVRENQVLNMAALNKAEDMLFDEYFAHVSPDNRALRHWLYDLNYNFRVAGENLAIGFSDANDIVVAWQESPTHYSNLIDPDFTEIGVGVISGAYNGYETTLTAQHFADPYSVIVPSSETPEPVPEPIAPEIKEDIERAQDYNTKVEQAVVELNEEEAIEGSIEEDLFILELQDDLVLAEKDEVNNEVIEGIDLKKPVLLSPEDGYISKDNINILNVLAQGANRVAVYSNGELIANKVIDKEKFDIAIKFDEGEHNLQLIAYQGQKSADSIYYTLNIDNTVPSLDQSQTYILVNKPSGKEDIVLKATAYLSEDTTEAFVGFADHRIDLLKDYSEDGKWTGHQVISGVNYDSLFNPMVLATLTAVDKAGNVLVQDINWEDIKPVIGSTVNQYSFLKQSNSAFIKPLFNIGNIYYQIMLILAFIALALNVFIQIRKQHVSTIASTLGLMALLTFLTIF